MLSLSHRGYHIQAPENTIEAFGLAVQMGIDGIETDLRVTRDDQVILFHDRIVPDGREIAHLTFQEVNAAVNYAVPRAIDAVEAFDGLLWNLEIKVPQALPAALEIVKQFQNTDRQFLLTSFVHPVIVECAALIRGDARLARDQHTKIRCGLLTADRPLALGAFLGETNETPRNPHGLDVIVWYYEVLDERLLHEARSLTVESFVYGVRTPADHERCQGLPLTGVITDHPEMMARAATS